MIYQQLYHHKLVSLLMTVFFIDQSGTSPTVKHYKMTDKLAQWDMQFHPSKCNSMSVTCSKTPFKYNYILKGHTLEWVETAKYLGVTISSNMTWNTHINNITSKAQKLLGFLRRNLQIKNEQTKSMAYKSLVRSNLEYCSTIWSPHTKKQKSEIEKVQRRASRYTTGRFHNTSSVTSMLDHLEWNSLETRRKIAKVTMLCKITNKFGCHQSRPLYLFSDITHTTQS